MAPKCDLRTFGDISAILIAQKERTLTPLSHLHMRHFFKNHLNPFFGQCPITEVTVNKVNAYIAKVAGHRTLFDDIKYIKMVLNYAFYEGWIQRVFKIRNPDPASSAGALVTKKEFVRLMRGCEHRDDLKLQILMGFILGMRPGEYCRCHIAFIDLKHGMIKLPAWFLKTRRMTDREIPLLEASNAMSPFAKKHIRLLMKLLQQRVKKGGIYLFPSSKIEGRSIVSIKSEWQRLLKRCGLKIRLYDLRHTCITNLVRNNTQPLKIRAMCGVSPQVMRRYSHIPIEELRDCLEDALDKAA